MNLIQSRLQDRQYIASLLSRHNVPGITYCFISKGRQMEAEAMGIKNSKSQESMQADTMFEAASLTKTLFSVLVMRLIDRGLISLDSPVHSLAPNLKLSEDERIKKITVRHILSHGTGLPNWADKPLDFLFDPGTDFSYSGEGYYYLHRVLNELTGKDFVDHFSDEFFGPLNMINSRAVWDPSILHMMTNKFDRKGQMMPLRTAIDLAGNAPEPNAAWSLYSGAEDYAKFLLDILMHKGHMSEDSFREMTKPQNAANHSISWGLGWGLTNRDASVIWHWGDNGGYRSLAVADLVSLDGACIFCNAEGGTDLCIDFLAYMTDGDFWEDIAEFIETAE